MARPHSSLLAPASLLVVSAGLLAAPATASAAPTTCEGKPVTIVATMTVTRGTEADDVVAMEPDGWRTFDALGGNDTICLAAGAGVPNNRDPLPPAGVVDAGPGDDVVVNLMPPGTQNVATTVVLGAGNDTFRGADVGETVFAEKQVFDYEPEVAHPELTGAQRDVVTGAATVFSGAPIDGLNTDSIAFGTRGAHAVLWGPAGPGFVLDVTAAPSARLEVRQPSSLLRASTSPSREVVIDPANHRVSEGGATTLAWTGTITGFHFGHPGAGSAEPRVSFIGTDADEGVTIADVPVGTVQLGAGDDALSVQAWNRPYVPQLADGGTGSDVVSLDSTCVELTIRLGGPMACNGIARGPLTDVEDVVVNGPWRGGRVTLVGTRRGERLVASGELVRVDGGAGADEIGVDDSYAARVRAGAGADRVWVSGDDVVVLGQAGADRIRLSGSAGISPAFRPRTWKQAALGGRGPDRLVGTTYDGPDRLIGGPGTDRANGLAGRRDLCRAEVTRNCERP